MFITFCKSGSHFSPFTFINVLFNFPGLLQSSQPSEAHPRGREDPPANQPANCRVRCQFTPESHSALYFLWQNRITVSFTVILFLMLNSWHLFLTTVVEQTSGKKLGGLVFMSLSGIWHWGYGYVMCGLGLRACSRLEIMEQMAVLQETSYEQLYRWAQSECSNRVNTTITLCTHCTRSSHWTTWIEIHSFALLSKSNGVYGTHLRTHVTHNLLTEFCQKNVSNQFFFLSTAMCFVIEIKMEINHLDHRDLICDK